MGTIVLARKPEPQSTIVDYSASDAVEDDGGAHSLQYNEARDYYYRLPAGYNAANARTYPLLMYLHGIDQTDYLKNLYYIGMGFDDPLDGSNEYLANIGNAFRAAHHCFVIVPQQSSGAVNSGTAWISSGLYELITHCIEIYHIDINRLYVHGFSMGGNGARPFANYAAAQGRPLAAILTFDGSFNPDIDAATLAKTSIWGHVGLSDTAERIACTRHMYQDAVDYFTSASASSENRSITSRTQGTARDEAIVSLTQGGLIVARKSEWTNVDHYNYVWAMDDDDILDWTFDQSVSNHEAVV